MVTPGGVRLHYLTEGSGKPVVMLHGFPETHRSWDLQRPALIAAGFRCVCVDLRGYGRSDRPATGYDLETLAADIASLIRHLDAGPACVVGHDWGGAVTWELASNHPECVERAAILDCPHPALMSRALRHNPRQLRRSWYMFFFQLPLLPERWLTRRRGQNLMRMFRDAPPLPALSPLVEAERDALLEPGAIKSALAFYRTAFRENAPELLRGGSGKSYPQLACPVALVWGALDSCLGTELIHGTSRYAPRLRVHVLEDAGHFVHQEQPEAVNALLRAFLAADLLTLVDDAGVMEP